MCVASSQTHAGLYCIYPFLRYKSIAELFLYVYAFRALQIGPPCRRQNWQICACAHKPEFELTWQHQVTYYTCNHTQKKTRLNQPNPQLTRPMEEKNPPKNGQSVIDVVLYGSIFMWRSRGVCGSHEVVSHRPQSGGAVFMLLIEEKVIDFSSFKVPSIYKAGMS